MKATSLLEHQHRHVESVFKKLESGKSGAAALLTDLSNSLAAHMAIEQELFYPAVKKIDEALIFEAYEEHALAELAIKRLLSTPHDHDSFKARVTAAKELIEHHVKEEEQDLFPKVEKALDEATLLELGKKMKARFDEVVAAGFDATVPKGFEKTSADVAQKALAKSA